MAKLSARKCLIIGLMAAVIGFLAHPAKAVEVDMSLGQQCVALCTGGPNSPCSQACKSIDQCFATCKGPMVFSDCGERCVRACNGLCRSVPWDSACTTACSVPVYAMMTNCMQSCPNPGRLDGCTGKCLAGCSASCAASGAPGCANSCTASLEQMAASCYSTCPVGDNSCAGQCHNLCSESCSALPIPDSIACAEGCYRQNANMPHGDALTAEQRTCLGSCSSDPRGINACTVQCMGGKLLNLPNPGDMSMGERLQLCTARCGKSPQTLSCMQECTSSVIEAFIPTPAEQQSCVSSCQGAGSYSEMSGCLMKCAPKYITPKEQRQVSEDMVKRYTCYSQCKSQANPMLCAQECLQQANDTISNRYAPLPVSPSANKGQGRASATTPPAQQQPAPKKQLAPAAGDGMPQAPIWR